MGSGGHVIGIRHGRGMQACGNESCGMGDIGHENSSDGISDLTERFKIDRT